MTDSNNSNTYHHDLSTNKGVKNMQATKQQGFGPILHNYFIWTADGRTAQSFMLQHWPQISALHLPSLILCAALLVVACMPSCLILFVYFVYCLCDLPRDGQRSGMVEEDGHVVKENTEARTSECHRLSPCCPFCWRSWDVVSVTTQP